MGFRGLASAGEPVRAEDVRDRLATRWPNSEYVHAHEVPDPTGRRIDVLIVGLWQSRGQQVEAVEIKVSISDLRRELKEAAKADWWWQHSHRFWLAAPPDVTAKLDFNDLPPAWGLLTVPEDGPLKIEVKPPKRVPSPIPWRTTVEMLRCVSGAGMSALDRSYRKGRDDGYRQAQQVEARRDEQSLIYSEMRALKERIAEFEKTSGIALPLWSHDCGDAGVVVAAALSQRYGLARGEDRLGRIVEQLQGLSADIAVVRDAFVEVVRPGNCCDVS